MTCSLWTSNFAYNSTSLASTYILAGFTIEVYMAIAHPVTHKNMFNRRIVTIIVVCCWVFGIALNAGINMGTAYVINGLCYLPFGRPSVAVPVSIFVLRIIVPILIYGLSYALTFASLKARVRVATQSIAMTAVFTNEPERGVQTNRANVNAASANQQQYSRASVNVAITVLYTILIHVAAWSGSQIIILRGGIGYDDGSLLLVQIFVLATYSTSCVNPFVYIIKYKEFRNAAKRVWWFSHKSNTNSTFVQ